MTSTFINLQANECRAIIGACAGPDTPVCAAPRRPGSSYCPDCHSQFYYRPTKRNLNTMDFVAGKPRKRVKGWGK